MRIAVGVVTLGLLAGAGIGPLSPPAGAAERLPDEAVVRSQAVEPVPGTEQRSRAGDPDVVAELAPTRSEPFGLVGVTWDPATAPDDLGVEVQVHTDEGWGRWQPMEYVPDEGPSTTEEPAARAGTAPLWVGPADGVAVQVRSGTGSAPADVRVVRVATSVGSRLDGRSVAQRRPSSGDAITGSPRFPSLPRVITRRQWKADPAMGSSCYRPHNGRTAKMAFVHHTAGSSRYSVAESPAIVRSILAYHTQGQDWCDIGYNALIDRFGNIYEGRRGGLRKPVRGAHAGDYNTNSVGTSLMGNFVRAQPSRRMLNALVRFVGWRLGTSFTPVRGATGLYGHRFARISGHRDAMSTSCPGGNVYDRLPNIRRRVAAYLDNYDSAAQRKAGRLGDRRTGPVFMGEQGTHGGKYTVFAKGRMYVKERAGVHWLSGRPLAVFRQIRGVGGPLGWPSADPRAASVRRWTVAGFQDGRVYLRAGRPARVVHGRIAERYAKLGYASGRLGLPTSSIRRAPGGQRATFRHGTLRWDRSSNRVMVRWT